MRLTMAKVVALIDEKSVANVRSLVVRPLPHALHILAHAVYAPQDDGEFRRPDVRMFVVGLELELDDQSREPLVIEENQVPALVALLAGGHGVVVKRPEGQSVGLDAGEEPALERPDQVALVEGAVLVIGGAQPVRGIKK